ncbi:MAG: DUF302 domain-containing protein [Actinomycetota bacterium]|nr:DUF302 domain-containing protein [Actinomycetota bacterium]
MAELAVFVDKDMATAEADIRAALAARGFGVLTEIDVAATLKNKIGVERSALKILGACNPGFAHRALEADPEVALFMPCNVVLEQVGDRVKVSAMDPSSMMQDPGIKEIADDATKLLDEALHSI